MTSVITPAPMPVSTSVSPTAHQIWTRCRGPLLALALLLVAGIVMAALSSGERHGRLDPRSADPVGSRAVAELLKSEGVSLDVVTTLDGATSAAGTGTTLLVTDPDLLTARQQRTLRAAMVSAGGRTVLLAAGPPSVSTLVPGVRAKSPVRVVARAPRCSLKAAGDAGAAELGGERYSVDAPGADSCYPSGGAPTLLRVAGPSGDTVLLGSADLLHNERLAEQGNASLALGLLGSRAHLVWYLPSLSDASAAEDSGRNGFFGLIPPGWLWGTFQLFLAAVSAALWRARRLGPLVTERLPVTVRASEATEGRARLYRKVDARDRAADVLRTATRDRLAPLLGVAPTRAHTPETLIPAVSARLPGTERDLPALLFGAAPADDAALIRLADQLDALEGEVRTS
jgi:hypothetical protein